MVTFFASAASRAETFARPALTAADRGACTWFAALLAGLLLAIPGQGLHAAEQPPGADLVSVHAWLLQHNPDLRALQAETEAAEAQILPAGALPDPMATLGLRGIDPDRPSFLPGDVDSATYQLRQRVPLWGKRGLARDAAGARARAAGLARDAAALELQAEAESAYVRYWHAGESLQVIDRQIVLLEQVEEIAGVRYALGMTPQQDAIRAQVELSATYRARIQRSAARDEAAAMLNVALGRRADAALRAPAAAPTLPIVSPTLTAALSRLDAARHPWLQAKLALADAANRDAELQRRARWPDITLGIGLMQRDERVDSYELMFEVEVPLQRRALRERERAAYRMRDATVARADAARNALAGRLGVAWTQWRAARAQRNVIETAQLPQADANFKSALASYQVGEVDFGTLLEALNVWQGTDLARVDALRDELLGAAAVRALEGETP